MIEHKRNSSEEATAKQKTHLCPLRQLCWKHICATWLMFWRVSPVTSSEHPESYRRHCRQSARNGTHYTLVKEVRRLDSCVIILPWNKSWTKNMSLWSCSFREHILFMEFCSLNIYVDIVPWRQNESHYDRFYDYFIFCDGPVDKELFLRLLLFLYSGLRAKQIPLKENWQRLEFFADRDPSYSGCEYICNLCFIIYGMLTESRQAFL